LSSDGIELNLSLGEDLPDVLGDAIEIQQVITNLIQNAVEAMDQGGALSISVHRGLFSFDRKSPAVIIKVQDTGLGIPLDRHQEVFNPFFTTKPYGTGLGLAIAHRIVSHHGGILSLESSPGVGTTFFLELPLAPKD
jgi:signal transduction histidine kinase